MNTRHKIVIGASQHLAEIKDNSIDLVVTSPPYPMIEMWDGIMEQQNPSIGAALINNPTEAFELMHRELDKVWREVARVLRPGCFACINIGDATRTINGAFALYPNHARIISSCLSLGLVNLPNILWRKQTNAPNKFMGSGMLPAGAYVTLEHEWILIFRKGGKRVIKSTEEKLLRKHSAFFWEERNLWFSDLWDLKGVKQKIHNAVSRERSAAYPFEVPYRLVNMYSLQGDTVLDPFMGTGTTAIAAMASMRHSIGYEIDAAFSDVIAANLNACTTGELNRYTQNRLEQHRAFIESRAAEGKNEIRHYNTFLDTPVITSQEVAMQLPCITGIRQVLPLVFEATYDHTAGHAVRTTQDTAENTGCL